MMMSIDALHAQLSTAMSGLCISIWLKGIMNSMRSWVYCSGKVTHMNLKKTCGFDV